jgi:hypothetical protein
MDFGWRFTFDNATKPIQALNPAPAKQAFSFFAKAISAVGAATENFDDRHWLRLDLPTIGTWKPRWHQGRHRPRESGSDFFSRVQPEAQRRGIGLHCGALVRKSQGGTLTAASAGFGRGATFTLELPLKNPCRSRAAGLPKNEKSENSRIYQEIVISLKPILENTSSG